MAKIELKIWSKMTQFSEFQYFFELITLRMVQNSQQIKWANELVISRSAASEQPMEQMNQTDQMEQMEQIKQMEQMKQME